jgi:hypothetical protein
LPSERPKADSFPDIDEAVQREFLALREYLTHIEQSVSNGDSKPSGARIVMPNGNGNGQRRAWWIILQGVDRLPIISTVRERIARLPGCLAAQVVSLSSSEIRLSITTTGQVDQHQLEFAVAACHDVPKSQVIARNMRPVK